MYDINYTESGQLKQGKKLDRRRTRHKYLDTWNETKTIHDENGTLHSQWIKPSMFNEDNINR